MRPLISAPGLCMWTSNLDGPGCIIHRPHLHVCQCHHVICLPPSADQLHLTRGQGESAHLGWPQAEPSTFDRQWEPRCLSLDDEMMPLDTGFLRGPDQFHFPLFRQLADRTVTTLHGRQDLSDLKPLYIGFSEMPLVSVSNDQRRPIANANFVATVHHGIPTDLHKPIYNPRGGYVAFLAESRPKNGPTVPFG